MFSMWICRGSGNVLFILLRAALAQITRENGTASTIARRTLSSGVTPR